MSSYKIFSIAMVATLVSVVSGCGGSGGGSVSTKSIEPILTDLNFNYGYSNSATRFTQNVSFSESNIVISGNSAELEKYAGNTAWFCSSLSDNSDFLCMFMESLSQTSVSADLFTFGLDENSNTGNGRYERCDSINSDAAAESCALKLLTDSDGDVVVVAGASNLQSDFSGDDSITIDADTDPDASQYKLVEEQATQQYGQSTVEPAGSDRKMQLINALSSAFSKMQ